MTHTFSLGKAAIHLQARSQWIGNIVERMSYARTSREVSRVKQDASAQSRQRAEETSHHRTSPDQSCEFQDVHSISTLTQCAIVSPLRLAEIGLHIVDLPSWITD